MQSIRARLRGATVLAVALTAATHVPAAPPATAAGFLAAYAAQAGTPADAERGRKFFSATHGREWSCASCHTAQPVQAGRHASTGKPIAALAPSANAERFTDAAKVEKWFRRNCNDVLGRECTSGERADVLAWLTNLGR